MLTFKLIANCRHNATEFDDGKVDFLLEESDFEECGYRTLYYLYATSRLTKSKTRFLGPINIVKLGQTPIDKYLIREKYNLKETFSTLPPNFYSITFTLDIFNFLVRTFEDKEVRKEFVEALRLILKEEDEYYQAIKDDWCFKSLFLGRYSMDSFYLKRGRELLLHEGTMYNLRQKSIKIKYLNCDNEIELNFRAVSIVDSECLPNGVVAFIGKNGCGKSTVLYKLANMLYATPNERKSLEDEIGKIEPSDIGISQLMMFSYSPFDNFMLPGALGGSDMRLWAEGIEDRTGRFVYCGLRDVKKEAEDLLREKISTELQPNLVIRSDVARLKTIEDLDNEIIHALLKIYSGQNIDYFGDWLKFLENVDTFIPELSPIVNDIHNFTSPYQKKYISPFLDLSTGHKFFFHAMLHIFAYCEDNALLMFDEPENYLQAPLLSFMLSEVRKILFRRKSVMLIATHSPVVLQETMSKNVRIMRRDGDRVSLSVPRIETYGESFGTISSEVFDLNTDRVQFFNAIDEIYKELCCDQMQSVEDVLVAMEFIMGKISGQALHYIISKYIQGERG